jgi:hypothetical protein
MRPRLAPILVVLAVAGPAAPAAAAATFAAPVQPATIEPGCDYGDTECLDRDRRHAGVDYLPDESSEPILAAADGIVRIAAEDGTDASHDFGNVVVLEHALPEGGRVSTVYGHLREEPAVRPGDCVRGGARIGTMGRTGAATNTHLHFEVKARPTLGPPYGYTAGDPDDFGFFDPKLFVGRREAAGLCGPREAPPAAGSACDRGAPRAALAGVTHARRETRASGRVRRLPPGCRVQLALVRRAGERCAHWRQSRRRMEWRACDSPLWTGAGTLARAGELARFGHRFGARLAPGRYELSLRLVDARGHVHLPGGRTSTTFSRP